MANQETFDGWDPMKSSYEQKAFNTYAEQPYNANITEQHTPVLGYVNTFA